MNTPNGNFIGYACAYTPLALIDAAGFTPYKILPVSDVSDIAGQHLHDNICPHVKRILDRISQGDTPELKGLVLMNSCDGMRRLHDAIVKLKGADASALIDLPPVINTHATAFFSIELKKLIGKLIQWGGKKPEDTEIISSIGIRNKLSEKLNLLKSRAYAGKLSGGLPALQKAYNMAATTPVSTAIKNIENLLSEPETPLNTGNSPAIFLFGNVLNEPEAFRLIEDCGARIAGEDMCSGSRLFAPYDLAEDKDIISGLAQSILNRTPCARTFDPANPGLIIHDIIDMTRQCGATGVICHTLKFCDPYLARIYPIRQALQQEGIPMLIIEGDCTLRSIGQQHTRIETFIEMLR